MRAGKRWYPQDTAVIGADEEMNPTITTGTLSYMGVSGPEPSPQDLYGSGQAMVSPGHSGPAGIDDDARRNGLRGDEELKLKA